jgi:hypothetical protein|tara:strand:- start:270 stop:491 length:222 start_codon:yes stop_codon:yes gene_type:complete
MIKIINDQFTAVGAGTYTLKATGALTIQFDLGDGEGYQTITDGVFTEAKTVLIALPSCDLKIISAGANKLTIA